MVRRRGRGRGVMEDTVCDPEVSERFYRFFACRGLFGIFNFRAGLSLEICGGAYVKCGKEREGWEELEGREGA